MIKTFGNLRDKQVVLQKIALHRLVNSQRPGEVNKMKQIKYRDILSGDATGVLERFSPLVRICQSSLDGEALLFNLNA